MNNGLRFRSGPRMDYKSGRLLYDCEVLVLEENLERDLLWREWCWTKRFEIDFDGLSASNPVSGFVLAAIDANCSGFVEYLDLRTSDVAKVLGKKDVQTQTLGVMPGLNFHCG